VITKEYLSTRDKIRLACEHGQNGFDSIVIVCPGFFNSKDNHLMKATVEMLSDKYDTFIFDFRGHGESSGLFTWLAKEHHDLGAVLDFVKTFKYKTIGILGYSLGAAVSINTVSHRDDVDCMVLISTPMNFWKINYHFWEPEMLSDLKDNFECEWKGKGARVNHFFIRKQEPIKEIKKIENTPVFFIHGQRDWIIKSYHSEKLYEASKGIKRLRVIEGGLHAERLLQRDYQGMKEDVLGWFSEYLNREV